MFQRLKGEGRSTYYDNHNSNDLVFQLRGGLLFIRKFFSFQFYHRTLYIHIFFLNRYLRYINPGKNKIFSECLSPPSPLSISLPIPPSLLLLNFLRAQKSEVQSQRVSKNITRTVALQRAQSAGEIMICSR